MATEPKDVDLKERIKYLIQQLNINDASFAQNIQVNKSTLSQCLNGPNGVSKEILFKICETYPSISHDWLFWGKGNPYKYEQKPLDFSSENDVNPIGTPARPEYSKDLWDKPPVKTTLSPENKPDVPIQNVTPVIDKPVEKPRRVVKIMVYYSDNTFETYSLDKM